MDVPRASTWRYDLEWLRVGGIYLLLPVHAAIVFSPWPFYHIRNRDVTVVSRDLLGVIEPWLMPLFFVLAGWATFHSLRFRGVRGYLRERFRKLFVPFFIAVVLFMPPIKYLELRSGFDANYLSICAEGNMVHSFGPCLPAPGVTAVQGYVGRERDVVTPGSMSTLSGVQRSRRAASSSQSPTFEESFLAFWPTFFMQPKRITWSHLWFMVYLFVFSVLYLPIFARLARMPAPPKAQAPARPRAAWIYLPLIPLLLIEAVLRPHWLGANNLYRDWANFAYYSVCLIAGFLLARHPGLEQAVRQERQRALVIGILCIGLRMLLAFGVTASMAVSAVALVGAGWGIVVALLGYAQIHLARPSRALGYLGELVYPVYVLHQLVVVGIGYWVIRLPLGIPAKFLLLLILASTTTLVVVLCVRRVPLLRLAFGMKPRREVVVRHKEKEVPCPAIHV